MDLTTFHLFPQLAPELRFKIWAHACTPRNVSVRYEPHADRIQSSTAVPAILHATRESRHQAGRLYALCFATPSRPAPRVYFAPDLDTLYIPRYRSMGYDETLRDFRSFLARPGDLDAVGWLALDFVAPRDKRPWEAYGKACLIRSCPALAAVFIVLGHPPRVEAPRATMPAPAPVPAPTVGETGSSSSVVVAAAEAEFREPRERLDEVMKACSDFREAWVREERARREVLQRAGGPYVECLLPPVKVVVKG
ncbi:MAG: hypothetical protein M1818_006126 [Claussenomyces sp. TS43310]|nr:MAG: hypothetical protein M1818_006126 [Claussenomyces sp. TS43310]